MQQRALYSFVLLLLFSAALVGENRQVTYSPRVLQALAAFGSGIDSRTELPAAALVAADSAVDADVIAGAQAFVRAKACGSFTYGGGTLGALDPQGLPPSHLHAQPMEIATSWLGSSPTLLLVIGGLFTTLFLVGVRLMRCMQNIKLSSATLNATGDGVLVVNLSGAVVYYNPKLEKLFNLPKNSHQVRRADEFLRFALPHLKSPEEFLDKVLQKRADPQVTIADTMELKDGRIFERHFEPHRIGNRVVGRIWVFHDATECRRKLAECHDRLAVLEEKGRIFRTFIDSVPECIYFKDRASRFTRVNQTLAHAHGYDDPREMIGKSDFDSCAAEHAHEAYSDEQDLVNEVVPIIAKEERENWPDGRETWVLTTKMPLRDPDGAVIGTFGISRDITKRKLIEQSLVERERWLSAVLSSIQDCVVALDSLGVVQWINPSAARLTGGSCEDSRGKLFEDVVQLVGKGSLAANFESTLLNSLLAGHVTSLERLDAAIKKADGSSVFVELSGSAIEVGDNIIAGAVLVLRPIGERDEALLGRKT